MDSSFGAYWYRSEEGDKFYKRLPEMLKYLEAKGYQFQTVAQLLGG